MANFNKLKQLLYKNGASLIGFANLKDLNLYGRYNMNYGISIVVALNPKIVNEIINGPTKEYQEEYWSVNKLLDKLNSIAATFLQDKGYNAIAFSATSGKFNPRYSHTLSTNLPHKTVATRAGIGWIGKCALLITKHFGSAIRLTTVLTNAPFNYDAPIKDSLCGDCMDCVQICPGKAVSGKNWEIGMFRDEFFNLFKCEKAKREISLEKGLIQEVCGKCISVCPWTKNYTENNC